MKVQIDAERCMGHGICFALAPEVFVDDGEGYGQVKVADTPEALRERAQLGVHVCPEGAISLLD